MTRGALLAEHLAHPLLLLAVREHRREHRRVHVPVVLELAQDPEHVVLGVVDAARAAAAPARAIWRHSSDADRAAGAGHQHDLALEVARRRGRAPSAPARARARPRRRRRARGGRS